MNFSRNIGWPLHQNSTGTIILLLFFFSSSMSLLLLFLFSSCAPQRLASHTCSAAQDDFLPPFHVALLVLLSSCIGCNMQKARGVFDRGIARVKDVFVRNDRICINELIQRYLTWRDRLSDRSWTASTEWTITENYPLSTLSDKRWPTLVLLLFGNINLLIIWAIFFQLIVPLIRTIELPMEYQFHLHTRVTPFHNGNERATFVLH